MSAEWRENFQSEYDDLSYLYWMLDCHIVLISRNCTECVQPVEVVSYKIGVCKVSPRGKECRTEFERLSFNGKTSVVLCRPFTGRMHQIRVHLQYLGFPVINDPLYNHVVFGANKGKGGLIGKSDDQLIQDLVAIHNAENWLGMDGDSDLSMFNKEGGGGGSGSNGGGGDDAGAVGGSKVEGSGDVVKDGGASDEVKKVANSSAEQNGNRLSRL